jgi:ornithine carbamoyltransferase
MHPLPADLSGISCPQGEVSKSVFERYRHETYHEAEHKLYVIAAMIMNSRFAKPAAVFKQLVDKSQPRRLA